MPDRKGNPLPFYLYVVDKTDPEKNAPLYAAFENSEEARRFIQFSKDRLGDEFVKEEWILVDAYDMEEIPHTANS